MADKTRIEWADATVNAINGCSVTSPGCTNCYAMKLAGTRMKTHPSREGLTVETKAGPVWNGEVRLHEPALLQPLSWSKPRRIFWNAHGDTFHDAVPDEWIDRIFAVAALTPQHTHMILTKRSKRMREYFTKVRVCDGVCDSMSIVWDVAQNMAIEHGLLDRYQPTIRVLPNVWLGVSVEDQTRADERIPHLLATPAAVRFLSCEPLLGPVDLHRHDSDEARDWLTGHWFEVDTAPDGGGIAQGTGAKIDWVIAGGESGPGARPMHPDWARSLRDQCAAAGVPFHFKQWGEWAPVASWPSFRSGNPADVNGNDEVLDLDTKVRSWRVGKKRAGRLLDGIEHNGMPEAHHA
jgi:protein gp37